MKCVLFTDTHFILKSAHEEFLSRWLRKSL